MPLLGTNIAGSKDKYAFTTLGVMYLCCCDRESSAEDVTTAVKKGDNKMILSVTITFRNEETIVTNAISLHSIDSPIRLP